jgi:hypothetical protein
MCLLRAWFLPGFLKAGVFRSFSANQREFDLSSRTPRKAASVARLCRLSFNFEKNPAVLTKIVEILKHLPYNIPYTEGSIL